MMYSNPNHACACGSGRDYEQCCAPLHQGDARAEYAEQLMRSRYSAFALKNAAYLLDTWEPGTRPASVDFSNDEVEWTRLEIIRTNKGSPEDSKGMVEFKAYYLSKGCELFMHEISRFTRFEGRWFYRDGTLKAVGKPVKAGRI